VPVMVVVGLVASAIGIALGLAIDWFPAQASTQAKEIDTLWDVLVICSVPVFVLVAIVVLFSVINFRMRPGQELEDGPPIHGNTRLEVVWTAIPAIMLVSLCSYAYIVLHDIEKAPASTGNELQVKVTGEQFAWSFEYPSLNGKKVASPQLYLPQGRPVRFSVVSKDVIHDFWVPAFRVKIDAVPGITTRYRVTPTRPGTYPVVCAELCGLGHAFMRQTVHVLPPAQFDDWARRLTSGAAGGAGGNAGGGQTATVDAKKLFVQGNGTSTACGACHTLSAAGTSASIGPALDAVLKGKDAAFIKQSIVDPNAVIAKGFSPGIMPGDFRSTLSPKELDALVQYLSKVTSK
jgi:cytochrome c oxidase subunit II